MLLAPAALPEEQCLVLSVQLTPPALLFEQALGPFKQLCKELQQSLPAPLEMASAGMSVGHINE
jgi:hypothetical protein